MIINWKQVEYKEKKEEKWFNEPPTKWTQPSANQSKWNNNLNSMFDSEIICCTKKNSNAKPTRWRIHECKLNYGHSSNNKKKMKIRDAVANNWVFWNKSRGCLVLYDYLSGEWRKKNTEMSFEKISCWTMMVMCLCVVSLQHNNWAFIFFFITVEPVCYAKLCCFISLPLSLIRSLSPSIQLTFDRIALHCFSYYYHAADWIEFAC